MISTILLLAIVIYIVIIILWRLFISIMMIIEGYREGGIKGGIVGVMGALGVNLLMILGDIWGLVKFAIVALIILFIIRACSS
jgi:hypothetical protein